MAKIFDRVKFNVSGTPGTGTVTIGTRAAGGFYLPAERGAVDGDEPYYIIVKANGDEETGIGTVGDGVTTVSRDLVLGSIIGGVAGTTKINLDASAVMAFVAPAEAFRSLRGHREVTGSTDTIANGDGGGAITYNRATAVAVSIAQAGTSSLFLKTWFVYVQNIGAGATTITPATSTINGAATLVLAQNLGAFIWSDGTNYRAFILPVTKPLLAANNLSDIANAATSRSNLGAAAAGTTISGGGLVTGGGDLSANRILTVTAAVKADQTSANSTSVAVVPAIQHNHPSAAKAWGFVTVVGTSITAFHLFGCTVARTNVGIYTVTFSTAFTGAGNYCCFVQAYADGDNIGQVSTQSAGSFIAHVRRAGALYDGSFSFAVFGTQ